MAGFLLLLALGLSAALPAPARAEWGASSGGIEVHFAGLALFPKWRSLLHRFEAQLRDCREGACESTPWSELLDDLDGLGRDELVRMVDRRINALPYVSDAAAWRKADHWATPFEFLEAGGDCEDYAAAKYLVLRALGLPAAAMRIAVVWDGSRRLHHAVLLVRHRGAGMLLLDNLSRRVRNAVEVRGYVPIYSINEEGWWLHGAALDSEFRSLPSIGLDNDARQPPARVGDIQDGRGNRNERRVGGAKYQ